MSDIGGERTSLGHETTMRTGRLLLGLASTTPVLLWAVSALAQEAGREITLSGVCKTLSYQGRDKAINCSRQLTNVEYNDGRHDFVFSTSDGMTVTFRGIGPAQVDVVDRSAVQPLDSVIIAKGGRSDRSHAEGTCQFGDLQQAGPEPVICKAQASLGLFQATFVVSVAP